MLSGHTLVEQHGGTHRGVPARTPDDALKTQVEKTRVDLRGRTPRADEQAMTTLLGPGQRGRSGGGHALARIAQRPINVNKNSARSGVRSFRSADPSVNTHEAMVTRAEQGRSTKRAPEMTNHAHGR